MSPSNNTLYTVQVNNVELRDMPCEPTLFVRYSGVIESFRLSGRQRFGRKAGNNGEICVPNPFISRDHGCFETQGSSVRYTASSATNGIFYNRKKLNAGETVVLGDGDKLTIPTGINSDTNNEIMVVCALTKSEHSLWSSFVKAQFDPLTELPNRKIFSQRFMSVISSKTYKELNLFILDIDNFKSINDDHGHDCGDSALKLLAKKLRDTVDNIYHVCRWGGDEFVGILSGTTASAVSRLENMSRSIASEKIDGKLNMTISVGLCRMEKANSSLDELLKNADIALYRSKEEGKARVSVFKQ